MTDFSIIIPAYQHLMLLQKSLSSVLQQEGVSFDVIVTDDSEDSLIMHYVEGLADKRVKYLRHDRDRHPVSNWNYGLRQVSGKYVILMHHDESMWEKDYLKRVMQHLDEGVDVVVTHIEVFFNDRKKPDHFPPFLRRFIYKHPASLFLFNAVGPTACVAFRREHLQMLHTELVWLIDVEWYYRLFHNKRVCYLEDCHIKSVHGHEGQISGSINVMESFKRDKSILCHIYADKFSIRLMLFLYLHLILGTKRILKRI